MHCSEPRKRSPRNSGSGRKSVIRHFSGLTGFSASAAASATGPMGSHAVLGISAAFWILAAFYSLLLGRLTSYTTPAWWYLVVYGCAAVMGYFVHYAGHQRWVRPLRLGSRWISTSLCLSVSLRLFCVRRSAHWPYETPITSILRVPDLRSCPLCLIVIFSLSHRACLCASFSRQCDQQRILHQDTSMGHNHPSCIAYTQTHRHTDAPWRGWRA